MITRRSRCAFAALFLTGLLSGCGGMADNSYSGYDAGSPPEDPPDVDDRAIEESDLYKLVDDWLYVQNPSAGLSIIDVSNPDEPLLHRQVGSVRGEAGELYVREDRVYVLFHGQTGRCTLAPDMEATWASAPERSEIVVVITAPDDPKVASRYCLPGDLVGSRIVGDVLYAVTSSVASGFSQTWIFSIDVVDPENLGMVDFRLLTGDSREVHVTTEAIFLAQATGGNTLVQYVDISDPEGVMVERGDLLVEGAPQGRFHMHAHGDTFRIVTFSGVRVGTNLHVIDTSDPDNLWLMSSYMRLAPNEELWGTLFVEDMAYIVTYERWQPSSSSGGGGRWVWGNDPLWVISLEDPYSPRLLGELQIPGWSNFLFPRGDQIVAVGRGDRGRRVAASLFDVSDPGNPLELERLEFGADEASSEANTDFRGVRIVEDEAFGHVPLIAVPYTNNRWDGATCTPEHHLQLIDLEDDDLRLRGDWEPSSSRQGLIRRTVPIGYNLFVISDHVVAALDVADRRDPWARVSLDVAGPSFVDECTSLDFEIDPARNDDVFSLFPFGCSVAGPPDGRGAVWILGAMLALALLRHVTSSSRRRRG